MTYPLARIDDHAEQAEALLIHQFRGKPRIRAWLLSYVRRLQQLEDAAWDVLRSRLLDEAAGAQLDGLGKLVGEPRGGKDDAAYRPYVAARIRINVSSGRAEDVLAVISLIEPAARRLIEYFPASLDVEFDEPTAAAPTDLVRIVDEARAASVRLGLVVPTADAAGSFTLSEDEGVVVGEQGWGDEGEAAPGGEMAGAYAAA